MFTYRECDGKDAIDWIEMNIEFMNYEIQDEELWSGAKFDSYDDFYDTFKEAIHRPEMISLLIFEEDGKPAGFANLMSIFSVWSHGKAMIIDDLFLREEFRGKGYGKKAMEYIEDFAKEIGCKRLQFQSEKTNPAAEAFYEALGYQAANMNFYLKYF